MPIPTSDKPNSSYPLVDPAISLINEYLEHEPFGVVTNAREHCLQLRLPRSQGTTYICHKAAHFVKALIVVSSLEDVRLFRHNHIIDHHYVPKTDRVFAVTQTRMGLNGPLASVEIPYDEDLLVYSVEELKKLLSNPFLVSDWSLKGSGFSSASQICDLIKNIKSVSCIFFDTFARYSDNKVVKLLLDAFGETQKFVML